MKRTLSSLLGLVLLLSLFLAWRTESPARRVEDWSGLTPRDAIAAKTVFLGGGLGDEDLIAFTSTVAASGHPGLLLLDSEAASRSLRLFLDYLNPERIIPVGDFRYGIADVQDRLSRRTTAALDWQQGPPERLIASLFERPRQVVVCPATPRRQLLHAARLAGAVRAPLLVLRTDAEETRQRLLAWQPGQLYAIGAARGVCEAVPDSKCTVLADEDAVAQAAREELLRQGPIQTLVVANAADRDKGGMSRLAPWIAQQRRGLLLLTNDAGTNTAEIVEAARKKPGLERVDTLLLVANLKAIPMERRPNPVAGKDLVIDMEPLTPKDREPFHYATGRLFHDDPSVVPLMLGRQRLLTSLPGPRRALIVSNPGGSLPLLETFSRHTVKEIHNGGYEVTALFNDDCRRDVVRRALPQQDIFMWEGHYRTMVDEYELPKWTEPLRPTFVFMQSCLALNEAECQPLLQRGAYAVLGSANRNYSGSGGAFSLAYFDALLYDRRSLGGALRQAKNFLLTYALLKEKRLGAEAKLQGSNLRSAWAFTLWGDPTVQLPAPEKPADALPNVRVEVQGQRITVHIPEETYPQVKSERYQAQLWPNARLAGLIARNEDEDTKRLVPLLFAEVTLPQAPTGRVPRLKSALQERNYVLAWDARRKTGYLLIAPGAKERSEIRFTVEWVEKEAVE